MTGLADTVVSAAMEASRVERPTAVTTASPDPSTTNVPANNESPTVTRIGTLSPVSIDVSTNSELAAITVASAGTRSPASVTSRSPRTTSAAPIITGRPLPSHGHPHREQTAQSVGRLVGLMLLHEREQRAHHDDAEDRHAQCRHAGRHGQRTGGPEHQCEEVDELGRKAPHAGRTLRLRQFVGPSCPAPLRRIIGPEPGTGPRSSDVGLGRPSTTTTHMCTPPSSAPVPSVSPVASPRT